MILSLCGIVLIISAHVFAETIKEPSLLEPNILQNLETTEKGSGEKVQEFKGYLADRGQFPWQVFIRFYNCHGQLKKDYCSGAILSAKTIITTANCTRHASGFEVLMGRVNINNLEESGMLIALPGYKDWTIHPNFTETTLNNNVALLYLPLSLTFYTETFKPIRLPVANDLQDSMEGRSVYMSGWGTHHDPTYSDTLLYGNVTVTSNKYCDSIHGYLHSPIKITDICIKGSNETTCQADFGSPFVYIAKDGIPTLVGLFSYGFCGPQQTAVGVRIVHYIGWINQKRRN